MSLNIDERKQQEEHTIEYFDQLGFDVRKLLRKKMANIIKKAQLPKIDIPDVEEKEEGGIDLGGKPKDIVIDKPNIPNIGLNDNIGDEEQIKTDIEDIEDTLTEIEFSEKLENAKEEMRMEFDNEIKNLKEELENFKERKIPSASQFDTGGVYKERIFELVTRVLDDALVPIIEDIPDYSLLATQVSRVFDDGTVSDAIVSVTATISNDGYRYDFKVDVPILNGIIHYPTYIQRGLKIIPLTKEKIMEELDSLAFRKIEVESPFNRENIFNNIGDNVLRKKDKQKWYDIYNTQPPISIVPPNAKWDAENNIKGK